MGRDSPGDPWAAHWSVVGIPYRAPDPPTPAEPADAQGELSVNHGLLAASVTRTRQDYWLHFSFGQEGSVGPLPGSPTVCRET